MGGGRESAIHPPSPIIGAARWQIQWRRSRIVSRAARSVAGYFFVSFPASRRLAGAGLLVAASAARRWARVGSVSIRGLS